MNKSQATAPGTDWTKLLTDPQIASHLGELLRAYREAPPEKRDRALLDAMRKIKGDSAKAQATGSSSSASHSNPIEQVVATDPAASPPFEPDIFTPSWGEDRRRYPRMKCFVAVELRMEGSATPVWGNLSNTSRGGCFVETATMLGDGAKLEIGLWVANGKIWVKGLIINGIVTRSNSFGLRIKFGEMEVSERERLREFLKFVENTTKGYHYQHGYLAQIKR
ncbi:MAG: PilZ domain-containing protein [Terriglobales bacterium]